MVLYNVTLKTASIKNSHFGRKTLPKPILRGTGVSSFNKWIQLDRLMMVDMTCCSWFLSTFVIFDGSF